MNLEQLNILKKLAKEKNYGRGPKHAIQVNRLTLRIYDELVKSGMLDNVDQNRGILEAAALLHDIALPKEPHNEVAFDFLSTEIPKLLASNPLPIGELSAILYCVFWHRDVTFAKRGTVDIADLSYTKKMAAILRVADALDRTLRQLVENVGLHVEAHELIFKISSKYSVKTEIGRAEQKSDLMKKAYALTKVIFEYAKQ